MQALVDKLAEKLINKNMMLVTAESCTGGLLASALTKKAGASAYFERGFITYSNESKTEQLDVHENIILLHGAVSDETAEAMAIGALKHSNAQISVSITGVAGPEGGSADKPVGTVYFGFSVAGGSSVSTRNLFAGSREDIQKQATMAALQALITIMDKQP
ncbi:MAG: CinA family protein [Alphaproteobacteria bacterium]|nr:CinA family protein [Alphaproteobacteria bacterium]